MLAAQSCWHRTDSCAPTVAGNGRGSTVPELEQPPTPYAALSLSEGTHVTCGVQAQFVGMAHTLNDTKKHRAHAAQSAVHAAAAFSYGIDPFSSRG